MNICLDGKENKSNAADDDQFKIKSNNYLTFIDSLNKTFSSNRVLSLVFLNNNITNNT